MSPTQAFKQNPVLSVMEAGSPPSRCQQAPSLQRLQGSCLLHLMVLLANSVCRSSESVLFGGHCEPQKRRRQGSTGPAVLLHPALRSGASLPSHLAPALFCFRASDYYLFSSSSEDRVIDFRERKGERDVRNINRWPLVCVLIGE